MPKASAATTGPVSAYIRTSDPAYARFAAYAGEPEFWAHRGGKLFLHHPDHFQSHLLPRGPVCHHCEKVGAVTFKEWNVDGPRKIISQDGAPLYVLASMCAICRQRDLWTCCQPELSLISLSQVQVWQLRQGEQVDKRGVPAGATEERQRGLPWLSYHPQRGDLGADGPGAF